MRVNDPLSALEDTALMRRLGELLRGDNALSAEIVRTVEEVDRRQLWAKLGHPSMFDLCIRRLRMSESIAAKRIRAARTARRLPVVLEMLAGGEIHLSGLHRLAKHLTEDNHREVLAEARHKTLREIDLIVARLAPRPDAPSRLRAVPLPADSEGPSVQEAGTTTERFAGPAAAAVSAGAEQATDASTATNGTTYGELGRKPLQSSQAARPVPPSCRAPDPAPLSPSRYKLQVTIGQEARDALTELSDLLAHQIPDGDPAPIVERALSLLLAQTRKKKAAQTDRPRRSSVEPSRRSRAIPAAIRRSVHARDGGRCAFIGEDGRRCNETRALEYAHIDPWAKGGAHSVDNIALRCRAHNAYEATRDYGELFMQQKRNERRGTREALVPYNRPVISDVDVQPERAAMFHVGRRARRPGPQGSGRTVCHRDQLCPPRSRDGPAEGELHGPSSYLSRARGRTTIPIRR